MSKFNSVVTRYFVKIGVERSSSRVQIAECSSADNALAVALNLHQLSSSKHYIEVLASDDVICTLIRQESEVLKIQNQK